MGERGGWYRMLAAAAVLAACESQHSPSSPDEAEPVTDIGMIAGVNGPDLAGHPVRFTDARVQEVISDRAFWIGPSADQRVLVVLQTRETPLNLRPGQTVNITGTVERVPTATEALRSLGLTQPAEDLLRIQIVYVLALQAE